MPQGIVLESSGVLMNAIIAEIEAEIETEEPLWA